MSVFVATCRKSRRKLVHQIGTDLALSPWTAPDGQSRVKSEGEPDPFTYFRNVGEKPRVLTARGGIDQSGEALRAPQAL